MIQCLKKALGGLIAISMVFAALPTQAETVKPVEINNEPSLLIGEQTDTTTETILSDIETTSESKLSEASSENNKQIITRIDWIHELAKRFYTESGGDLELYQIEFLDFDKSEEYYKEAVWAWNFGLFEENENFSINPYAPATREFAAYTLSSCLDLGLDEPRISTYSMRDNSSISDENQIAINREWFDNDIDSFDEGVSYNEVAVMLADAEEIVTLGKIDENYENTYEYANDVIELPSNINFEISEDESTVTLYTDTFPIEAGDNFVVYLESLPIAYNALEIVKEKGNTIISVSKADASVFKYVDAQGTIPLNAENSEFIPADGVMLLSASDGARGLDYSNGKLSLSTSVGDSKAEVYLDNLRLNHSFTDNGFTVTVSGNWGLGSTLAYKEEAVSEIPLGEVRIYGVGVIAVKLSLTMGMEMSGDFSGMFNAGASVLSDGTTRAIHEFAVTNCSVTGKGSLSAALKVSAGVDIVAAQAIVYGEVGLKTQYTSQVKENANKVTIHCQDYKYYLFLSVGAELNYYAFWKGEMETLVGKEIPLADETKGPFIRQWHWENGVHVGSCSMGMTVVDLNYGGTTIVGGGSLSIDNMNRVLETNVSLGYDVVVPNDFTIDNGAMLNLNGHTLTIEGDLIVSDGYLYIGEGTLNVKGDLRIQSVTKENGEKAYGESNGTLHMSSVNGVINIDGDFVTQSSKGCLYSDENYYGYGTINLKGNFTQLTGGETKSNFVCSAKVVLCGDGEQVIYFENPDSSYFTDLRNENSSENILFNSKLHGWTLQEDIILSSFDMVGTLSLNGHTLTVEGDLVVSDGYLYIGEGTLNVKGDLRIQSVTKENGEKAYGESNGTLHMSSVNGIINIDGDFVTQSSKGCLYSDENYYGYGTINLKGNFTQLTGGETKNNFVCSAKVVLCGDDMQTISFANYPLSKFTTLEITKPISNYEFNPNPCWDTLVESVTPEPTVKPLPNPKVTITENEDNTAWRFNVVLKETQKNSYVYSAIYEDNGRLIAVERVPLNTKNDTIVEVNKSEDAVLAKIFIWTDLLEPIANATSFDLR